jgi:hypothetical protein
MTVRRIVERLLERSWRQKRPGAVSVARRTAGRDCVAGSEQFERARREPGVTTGPRPKWRRVWSYGASISAGSTSQLRAGAGPCVDARIRLLFTSEQALSGLS